MQALQHLTPVELFTHAITDLANAISDRPGETEHEHFMRSQVATNLILSLFPRDLIEVMLAGHAVMFHALMTDSIHDTLRGGIDTMRRGTLTNIVALNRAFHVNLDKLAEYQARPSEATTTADPATRTPDTQTVPARTMADQARAASDDRTPRPNPSQVAGPGQTVAAEALTRTSTHPFAPQVVAPPSQIRQTHEPTAYACPPAEVDGQTEANPPRPPHLNRAQRRLLRHGRMAR